MPHLSDPPADPPADPRADPPADLALHVARTTGLAPSAAARVVDEVLAYYRETAAEFVRRRHLELKRAGATNDAIFDQIEAELPHRRVVPGDLSVRQLRRLVYG
ncbi:MAG: hypothetical protein ACRDP1_07985 [Nocardioidaceae bacterium]